MNHLPYVMQMASEQGGRHSGHALMATCPPRPLDSLPNENVSSQSLSHGPAMDEPKTHVDQTRCPQTLTMSKGDLSKLLDLSTELDLDGELTPVTAWGLLMSHPRVLDLGLDDLQGIAEALRGKIRCYG